MKHRPESNEAGWTRRQFIRRGCLAAAALAHLQALAAEKTGLSDKEILAKVNAARPLGGGIVPADLAKRLGTAHVSGRYFFTDKPYLIEGAERVRKLGLGGIKLWFNSVERAYHFNSQWKLPAAYTFKELARHPYFAAAFALPFSYVALEVYTPKLRDTPGGGHELIELGSDFSDDETQVYELSLHLLRAYRERDMIFILQNWEGDWMFRGVAREQWQKGEYPDLARRVESFTQWFNARQRGVERARAEVKDSRCRVFHAVEVNRVFDSLKGIPTLTTHVLPRIRPDFISWSSYDGLKTESRSGKKTALGMWRGLDLIQKYARTTQKDFLGNPAVYIGEIGFPEQLVPKSAVIEMMDAALGVLFARKIPYILHWELFCNERKDGTRPVTEPSDKVEDLRGFWLIRPDGSLGYTGEYFKRLLANPGKRIA